MGLEDILVLMRWMANYVWLKFYHWWISSSIQQNNSKKRILPEQEIGRTSFSTCPHLCHHIWWAHARQNVPFFHMWKRVTYYTLMVIFSSKGTFSPHIRSPHRTCIIKKGTFHLLFSSQNTLQKKYFFLPPKLNTAYLTVLPRCVSAVLWPCSAVSKSDPSPLGPLWPKFEQVWVLTGEVVSAVHQTLRWPSPHVLLFGRTKHTFWKSNSNRQYITSKLS